MSERVPTRFRLVDVKLTRSGPEITLYFSNPNPAESGTDIVVGIGDVVEIHPATLSVMRS